MRVIRNLEHAGERVLALGTFDGVHRGHQALLEEGKRYAQDHGILLRACSFNRHPLEVLRPETAPKLLTTITEKTGIMARCGVDELQLLRFTHETADTEPEAFLRRLRETVSLRAVAAGWNYTFGKGGRGNAELLKKDGLENGYDVLIVPPVMTNEGEIISSTLIRGRLQEGRIKEAEALMGHPYELRGRVTDIMQEDQRTGTLTVCIQINPRKQLPASGIYPCRMITPKGEYPAAVHIGTRPLLPEGMITAEACVPDRDPELYHRNVRIIPGDRIRPEQKSESMEAMTEQIRGNPKKSRKRYAENE